MAISVNDLARQSPDHIREWVEAIRSGSVAAPGDFNWLGLAYSAARNAAQAADHGCEDDALAWAGVAIAAYGYLSGVHGPPDASEDERSAMVVRADMIGRFGAVPGHPILDPASVERWFVDRLPLSLEDATAMTEDWTKRPVDEIRMLREIKNRLAVVQALSEGGVLSDSATLRLWLEIHDRLP
jgi:hypothetical protein